MLTANVSRYFFFYYLFVSKIISLDGRKNYIEMESLKSQHYKKSTTSSQEINRLSISSQISTTTNNSTGENSSCFKSSNSNSNLESNHL